MELSRVERICFYSEKMGRTGAVKTTKAEYFTVCDLLQIIRNLAFKGIF